MRGSEPVDSAQNPKIGTDRSAPPLSEAEGGFSRRFGHFVPRSIRNALGIRFAAQAEASIAGREAARQRASEAARAAERCRIAALEEAERTRRELERSREELRQERAMRRAEHHAAGSGIQALEHELRAAVSAANYLQKKRERARGWYRLIAATVAGLFVLWMLVLGIVRSRHDAASQPARREVPLPPRVRPGAFATAPVPENAPPDPLFTPSPSQPSQPPVAKRIASFDRLASILEPYPAPVALSILASANALLASQGQQPCSVLSADGSPALVAAPPVRTAAPVAEALERCTSAVERVLNENPPVR